MAKLQPFGKYWLPALVWMVIIFSGSSDAHSFQHSSTLFEPLLRWLFPQLSPDHVGMIHHAFRKCCHLTEYAILALLLWRAIHQTRKKIPRPLVAPQRSRGEWNWPEAGLALALVFLYAASDEIHQVFVPSRTALTSDVFIDASGGALGLLALWLGHKIFLHWKK